LTCDLDGVAPSYPLQSGASEYRRPFRGWIEPVCRSSASVPSEVRGSRRAAGSLPDSARVIDSGGSAPHHGDLCVGRSALFDAVCSGSFPRKWCEPKPGPGVCRPRRAVGLIVRGIAPCVSVRCRWKGHFHRFQTDRHGPCRARSPASIGPGGLRPPDGTLDSCPARCGLDRALNR
jgi:hypothetical protein